MKPKSKKTRRKKRERESKNPFADESKIEEDREEEEKKALYQMLGKLYLPDEVDADKVRVLKLLVNNLRAVSVVYALIVLPAQSELIR